ncbi:hypothetical protein RXV86_00265 [Alisedimentitalea sp. MJ-SS2]|uniref:SEL1-like repeat protein n=1 Tax=Aliisedimentitalea sp. MJ-SS2 TaxID=3049795 RepID=UPI00290F7510|nr:hypothetical protein [Alisedimentitalea sp. MJ-SS2]MDU8925809.1 hypothetical protein [Alisedimentitalea sp. MJ-SS2]
MTLHSFRLVPLCLACALVLGPNVLPAQTSGENPAQPSQPAAPTMAEIERAWAAGDMVFVREGLKILAETEGTALAQYRYGRVLANGHGGPRDNKAAATWLQKAVDQDHIEAMVLLARIYLSSKTEKGALAAAPLLQRAAARGNSGGQYYLALSMQNGVGMEADPANALNWLLAAGEQGHVAAQFELAKAFSRGIGTEKDTVKTQRWLTEAAANGHVQSQLFLALALDRGNGMKQDRAAALSWFRRAAEAGLPVAQRELGLRYLTDASGPRNVTEALRWLQAAAEAGDTGAQVQLGHIHLKGPDHGLPQDDKAAYDWYHRAAAAGDPRGMLAQAVLLTEGRGADRDLTEAVRLLRLADEEADFAAARLQLGRMAARGLLDGLVAPQTAVPWAALAVTQKDDAEALAWLEQQARGENRPARTILALLLQDRGGDEAHIANLLSEAAEMGDATAQFRLGMLYTTGAGIELDYVAAHKWFNIAATQGIAEAVEQRALLGQLMTPEQVATAQEAARSWMAAEGARAPQTVQQIKTSDADKDSDKASSND